MQTTLAQHNEALRLARVAMHYCSFEGASLGAWRDAVCEICELKGVEVPDDVLAWVSAGKASDVDVTDWSRAFQVT